jgi:hypothetical protein
MYVSGRHLQSTEECMNKAALFDQNSNCKDNVEIKYRPDKYVYKFILSFKSHSDL